MVRRKEEKDWKKGVDEFRIPEMSSEEKKGPRLRVDTENSEIEKQESINPGKIKIQDNET